MISVMNYHPVKDFCEFTTDQLLRLPPSNTMETTGDVFHQNFLLVDRKTQIVYRREQFERGNQPPVELIVRDRRFKKDEIVQMCMEAGLEVEFSRYVKAGNWENTPLINTREQSKEILVKCRKR